ncbi:hypothetical protein HYC85_012102 [Camellia sinensis]|uniref:NPH3 domain-containing protein n=1 Tax=Camellia sinensis TaxID=4442 RepID=A0A7J7HBI8_CAMSI|nr:hypothetical protein HYC85_012102 [Camellia sinensis]
MDVSCDLEVDVNGEEIFIFGFVSCDELLSRKILSSYSGRISKLFGKSTSATRSLKVIFHDFPGGAESFELMTRFCYNGKFEINPLNLSLLHCIAYFMEMNKSVSKTPNLLEQTEKSLDEIRYWTWSELLLALKQCQDLLPVANSSGVFKKCLDSLVGRIALASETSPCPSTSSPDSSVIRFSSLKASKMASFEQHGVTKSLVLKKFDHAIIGRFLFYYQKSRFILATSDEKRIITETIVNTLYSLDWSMISYKSLFGILRVALNLNISKCCKNKLESMIGSQIDQATLDNLLVPSPTRANYLYDINLVLRFLKSFLGKGLCRIPLVQLKKVASLMDLYIAEVAPDPCLRPSKMSALVVALPDSSRDSFDAIYHAIDMYLEVHAGLSEEEKINVCYGLNYEKLSPEAFNHLAQNEKFPSKSAAQALISQHGKLKSLLPVTDQSKSFIDSPCSSVDIDTEGRKDDACEQVVLYAGKLDLSAENEKLRSHLQGMQWRVLELEKACKKMQTQMTKIMKSRLSSQ